VPAARATVARLREAIERAVDDGPMAGRTARLASEIACEDGVGRAVELIETCGRRG
jgi:UDP:flavonoid glycosyltransferase YjiC (YdhE family)